MKIERESLILFAPAAYLFILPLAHTTALRSIAFGVSILCLLWYLRSHTTPPMPLKIPFAVWFAIAVLSLIVAVYPEYSIGEIKSEIVYGILTFAIFFSLTRGHRELNLWINVLAASSLVVGTFALVQFGRGISPYEVGTYGGAVHYSTYLALVIPIFLASSLLWPGRRRVAMLGLVFFLLITAYGSKNRGFWIALIVELGIFGYIYLRSLNLNVARRKLILAIIASALIVIAVAFVTVAGERLGTEGRANEVISDTIKNDLRPKLWKDSVRWIVERPWTGAGFGRGVLSKEIQQQQGIINHAHAHNIVLNYAIQLGVLGPIVLALLVFSVVRELLKVTKSVDREIATFGIAGLAIVGGIFGVQGMIEDTFVRHLGWLFWAVIGMILGYSSNVVQPSLAAQEATH
jgi:O-antigen ligase